MSRKIFGIDLGTTYSCISYVDEFGKPVIIPNSEGELTTPSVVYFESPSNVVVGRTAKEHSDIFPERVVSCIKRSMGSDVWEFECDGTLYKPQEISAFILRKLAADAAAAIDGSVEDVVITCPAYFGVNQKGATRQAGELAGLNVRYIIPEPTAAALAYLAERRENGTVMVYDLGGGTFDVTLIEFADGDIRVISTDGDDKLGGRNWDETIVDYFVSSFCEQTGAEPSDLYDDRELYQELVTSAETCKKSLSSRTSYRKNIRTGVYKAQVELSRETFEELTRPLLLRTLTFTADLLEAAARKGAGNVDKLLLVGGSTYMPQVRTGLEEMFGNRFEMLQFRPNQAVAEGAALYGQRLCVENIALEEAGRLTGESVQTLGDLDPDLRDEALRGAASRLGLDQDAAAGAVSNIASKGFGLLVMTEEGPRVRNLIYKDDPVPCEVSETFGTYDEGQTDVELRLMENQCASRETELLEPEFCTELSTVHLMLERPLPVQSPVRVTFRFSGDGLLTLDAAELTDGASLTCRVDTGSVMTPEELDSAAERDSGLVVE